MTDYTVEWKIDIEADSPEEAAMEALGIQRRPDSVAVVFEVTDRRTNKTVLVDLVGENI